MKRLFSTIILVLLGIMLFSCKKEAPASQLSTVTLWHNFGGPRREVLDYLVDEFNATVGKQKGVFVDVPVVTAASQIDSAIEMIVNGDPGAPALPDLFVSYPRAAFRLLEKDLVADFNQYFSKKELETYVDGFLEEGKINGGLYVFPIAKSTEVIFLNKTYFDRFAEATGARLDDLATVEGIAKIARLYYEWTDSLTPNVPNDGSDFFTADSWMNFYIVAAQQMGKSIFTEDGQLAVDSPEFEKIFSTLYEAANRGGIIMNNSYSSDLTKTAKILCSTGSSAGPLFYGDKVTLDDGFTENVDYITLPYPVFSAGDKKMSIQRGNGIMLSKSNAKQEKAACEFLKWLTQPEQNLRLVTQTSYLPVMKTALNRDLNEYLEKDTSVLLIRTFATVKEMYGTYDFFAAPNIDTLSSITKKFQDEYKNLLRECRASFESGNPVSEQEALENLKKRL